MDIDPSTNIRVGASVPEIVKNLITLCNRSKEPSLATFLPLLRFEGHPYSLKFHFQLEPLYRLRMPRRCVLMTGRQVGKSQGLVSSQVLRAGLIPNYHILLCEPLFQQIRLISNVTFRNMVAQSYIANYLMNNKCNNAMMLREFTSGSRVHFAYCGTDATRVRGTSGVRLCVWDESISGTTDISVVNSEGCLETKQISEIKEGDLIVSYAFKETPHLLVSPVVRDASYHGKRACFRVTTEQGRELICTADHLLPTSIGKKRLSEIIEYEFDRRSKDGWNVGDSTKRPNGKSTRGRLHRGKVKEKRLYPLESQCEAERLRECEVPVITRVRFEGTVRDTESRLREHLVSIDAEIPWAVSLVASAPISEQEEADNKGVSIVSDASNFIGMAVHGRRLTTDREQYSEDKHGQLYEEGSRTIGSLDEEQLGDKSKTLQSIPLLQREKSLGANDTERRLLKAVRNIDALYSTIDEVQNRGNNTDLSNMRESVSEYGESLLLENVFCTKKNGDVPPILLDTQGREVSLFKTPQTRETGAIKRAKLKGNDNDRTRNRSEETGQERLREKALLRESSVSREASSVKESLQGTQEERSCLYRDEESGETALLREGEERPRALCETSRIRTSSEAESGGEETRSSIGNNIFYWDRITSLTYVGEEDVYDIEVVGTHSYVLGNGLCSYNCDDMEVDVINIVAETMSAVREGGSYLFTGTPKLEDGTLPYYFNRSSGGEITIKCEHCNKINIASLDQDLLQMIGKTTCICAKCGKPLDVRKCYFSFRHPERRAEFDGFHLSQVTHPLHCTSEAKWREFLIKMETYPPAQFKNECLGEPCDEAVRLITRRDLEKATTGRPNTLEAGLEAKNQYAQLVLGVDWGGYGIDGESFTVIAVLGVRPLEDQFDVIYIEKIPTGATTAEQVGKAAVLCEKFGCSIIAHDGTGAGAIKEEMLIQEMEGTGITTVPLVYMWAPRQDTLRFMPPAAGRSGYYTLDKTRSLALTLGAIKAKQLLLPTYASCSNLLDDFLALGEDIRHTQNSGDVRLITRMGTHPDDTAHAINLAANASWYINHRRPALGSLVQRYDNQPDWQKEGDQ